MPRERIMAGKVARLKIAKRKPTVVCPICEARCGSAAQLNTHLARLNCLPATDKQEMRDALFDKLGSWKAVAQWLTQHRKVSRR